MKNVEELESAIRHLSADELAEFRRWFAAFDAAAWDAKLEDDVASGKLDAFAEQALVDFREGRTRPL